MVVSQYRPSPLRFQVYDGEEMFYDIFAKIFIFAKGEGGIFECDLQPDTAAKGEALLQYHKDLRYKYWGPTGPGMKQSGIATPDEERRFWAMQDEFVELCRKELDPKLYEIVEVLPPDPNPFEWEK